uniref:Uncharacterized protein n=1 Tax=Lepeophtheirus salmonis TaxID=72036 RepID=A0A0K2TJJ0_LEPSM
MAAIIAQMTRANRERKKKKRYEISKCLYDLPPFNEKYEPEIHNRYLRGLKAQNANQELEEIRNCIIQRFEEKTKVKDVNKSFSRRTCIIEATIIIGTLSIVPSLSIIILLFWPDDVDNLFEDGNGG